MSENPARTERIVLKHVHDIRNPINVIAMETILLTELSTDPNSILSVLRGLVLNAWSHHPRPVVKAGIINTAGTVILELREAPPRPALAPGAMTEEQLLVERNGGTLVMATDGATLEQVISLSFPVTTQPGDLSSSM